MSGAASGENRVVSASKIVSSPSPFPPHPIPIGLARLNNVQEKLLFYPGIGVGVGGGGVHKSFALNLLGPHYFQTLQCILFKIGMQIDMDQNFNVVQSFTPYLTSKSSSRT